MSLYIYSQEPPEQYDYDKSKRKDRVFAIALSAIGLMSILFAAGPLILWSVATGINFQKSDTPIPEGNVLSLQDQQIDVQVEEDETGFSYFTTTYTPQNKRAGDFHVTIPKLEIEKATAKIDSLNFYENLSHFPGTALPGEVGNVFVTGHSVLPQFADPTDYHKIFTKLPELEVGDIVDVDYKGERYRYVVQYKKVVNPKDISVIKPISKGSKNLTLMTCVPPGTSLKRMVVIASLI